MKKIMEFVYRHLCRGTALLLAAAWLLLSVGCTCKNRSAAAASEACGLEDDGDTTFKPALGRVSLLYDRKVPHAKTIDRLLAKLMDEMSYIGGTAGSSDSCWQWTTMVDDAIDSLYDRGLFHNADTSRYQMAMSAIMQYVSPSYGGNQAEMSMINGIDASVCHYLMMRRQQALVREHPELDFYGEYLLFNEMLRSFYDFQDEVDSKMGYYYTMRPLELACDFAASMDFRRRGLEAVQAIFAGDTVVGPKGQRPSEAILAKYFHELMPDEMRPQRRRNQPEPAFCTDTLGQIFMRWVRLRDRLSEQMPPEAGESYRNQTTDYVVRRDDLLFSLIPPF